MEGGYNAARGLISRKIALKIALLDTLYSTTLFKLTLSLKLISTTYAT